SDTTASGDFVWASAASETAPDSEWKLISPGGTGTDKSELTLAAAQKDQWIRATRGTVVSAPVGKVTEAAQTQGGDDTASGGDDVTPDTYSAAGLDKII
ncbi:MAG: hypothetical protein LBH00_09115, partial [Planctomycetaceae bacterium]|nr:hypothetical protein [Planctomycetaceae bacterium]